MTICFCHALPESEAAELRSVLAARDPEVVEWVTRSATGAGFERPGDILINDHTDFISYLFHEIERHRPALMVVAGCDGLDAQEALSLMAELKEVPLINLFSGDPWQYAEPYRILDGQWTHYGVRDPSMAERMRREGCERVFSTASDGGGMAEAVGGYVDQMIRPSLVRSALAPGRLTEAPLSPTRRANLMICAWVFYQEENLPLCDAFLAKAREAWGPGPFDVIAFAEELLGLGLHESALFLLDEAVAERPTAEVCMAAGRLAQSLGLYVEASHYATRALAIDVSTPGAGELLESSLSMI